MRRQKKEKKRARKGFLYHIDNKDITVT